MPDTPQGPREVDRNSGSSQGETHMRKAKRKHLSSKTETHNRETRESHQPGEPIGSNLAKIINNVIHTPISKEKIVKNSESHSRPELLET